MSENNGGDVLAKGGVRCQFRAAGPNVTAEQWAEIWREDEPKSSSGSPDAQKTGDVGLGVGESVPDATGF
jgi:hypothetical protein